MSWQRPWIILLLALLVIAKPGPGAEAPTGGDPSTTRPIGLGDAAAELAATIDQQLAAGWKSAGVEPAALADDAEFLRRASLDLAGKIPTVAEAREFLDDPSTDKRERLVDRLLGSPDYAAHMTDFWKAALFPEAANDARSRLYATDFEIWLRKQYDEGVSHDRIVRAILEVPLGDRPDVFSPVTRRGEPSPLSYLASKDGKPEELASGVARVFLGVRLECAQCHDHPFADWKRSQFWEFAAFFAGVDRKGPPGSLFQGREVPGRRELTIPGSERVVQATFLDGSKPSWRSGRGTRPALADWITGPENSYFARATVNRIWAQFFGAGLVEPVDDLGPENKPSHPELLDELARQFRLHGHDVKFLVRAILSSHAYQLTSAGGSPTPSEGRLFHRMPVRGMTPQQLYESFVRATGLRREEPSGLIVTAQSERRTFQEKFASSEGRSTDSQRSILQALTLMNGRLMAEATEVGRGPTLTAVAEAPFLDAREKLEVFYLATLTRRPRSEESERMVRYLTGGPTRDANQAYADIFWSLLNSAEFTLNH